MTVDLSRLDVPLPVVTADACLQQLLANPPAGHREELQPDDWYERVFDAMASAHPETCQCQTTQAAS